MPIVMSGGMPVNGGWIVDVDVPTTSTPPVWRATTVVDKPDPRVMLDPAASV